MKRLMYWFSRPVVRTYTGTMLKMNVLQHAAFPEGAKIIAANHPSTTDPFYVAKLQTARFYFAKLLPETTGLIRSARAGVAPLMAMDEALF